MLPDQVSNPGPDLRVRCPTDCAALRGSAAAVMIGALRVNIVMLCKLFLGLPNFLSHNLLPPTYK